MKFSCERCQTRYSISDEKVRGKVLKIRCKTCGNIVVVRESTGVMQAAEAQAAVGTGSAVAASTSGSSPGPAISSSSPLQPPRSQAGTQPSSSPGPHIDWYVAIKGKQHGPAQRDEIARLFREGRISERTYLWHEGLTAWTRLQNVPEFAFLLAEAQRRPPPPPPVEEGAEIVNFEAARAQRQQQAQQQPQPQAQPQQPQTHAGAVMGDPFAMLDQAGPAGLDNTQRESTRVFIMQAGLHNRGSKHKMYAAIAVGVGAFLFLLGVVDYHYDVLGLKQVVNAVAVSTGIMEAPPKQTFSDDDGNPELKCQLSADPADCVKKARAEAARRPKKARQKKPDEPFDSSVGFDVGGPTGDPTLVGSGGDPGGFAGVGSSPDAEAIRKALSGGKGGPRTPTAKMDVPQVSGANLDAENIKQVIKAGASAIQACVEQAAKTGDVPSGKQMLTVSITPRGIVERALFRDGAVSASGVGECITKAARKWKFAPFPGDTTDVEIPLVLSVGM